MSRYHAYPKALTDRFIIRQLCAISQHLQPIVDVIADQTGNDVVLFLVGPIPTRQGQLEARSISATRPGRRTGRGWVEDDPVGVTYTEQRLVEYAKGHFSMSLRFRVLLEVLTVKFSKC